MIRCGTANNRACSTTLPDDDDDDDDDNDTTWQPSSLHRTQHLCVLFWSGGKDSFLALRATLREQRPPHQADSVVLLTTFDAASRQIDHQDVSVDTVWRQARHLGLPLLGVPMHRGSSQSYVSRIQQALAVLDTTRIKSLVFGDLHLQTIRQWREQEMGSLKMGYQLRFPLFGVDYAVLAADLDASRVPCIVSRSTVDRVNVGQVYNEAFRRGLANIVTTENKDNGSSSAASVDIFGENGEFHTVAQVWEVEPHQALGLRSRDT